MADSDYKILYPVTEKSLAEGVIGIASSLLSRHEGRLVALGIVEVPQEMSLSFGAVPARRYRRLLEGFARVGTQENVEIRTLVRVSRHVWQGVVDAALEEDCDLILMGWDGSVEDPGYFYGTTIDEVAKKSPKDLVIVRPGGSARGSRILVPLRGGPHAGLALDITDAIAQRFGAHVSVMHVVPPGATDEVVSRGERRLAEYVRKHSRLSRGQVEIITTRAADVSEAIVETARGYDLIVLGASLVDNGRSPVGPIPKKVAERTDATLLITQARPVSMVPIFEAPDALPVEVAPPEVSDVVDKWFAENTFHAHEFSDVAELVRLKEKQNVRVSLGLPSLNEEATIGQILETIRGELQQKHPLIDEIVVVDSGSSDRTAEIAAGLGIPVFRDRDVLPQYGGGSGKGQALWKSLYVMGGDIVVWIDTDIRNIHPKFVYGLVGPLLKNPRIKYVKGFYRRPIKVGSDLIETGGGRVTELTARPLLNLFFPELSGMVQPLSGEYAGRREVLERVSFYGGYGVEIGLLINILEQFGLGAIGQVDLMKRIHRNQSLIALSKMSFAIIQVVVSWLEERHKVGLLRQINKTMKLIHHEPGQFYLELKAIEETARPPMVTVPEYCEKFAKQLVVG